VAGRHRVGLLALSLADPPDRRIRRGQTIRRRRHTKDILCAPEPAFGATPARSIHRAFWDTVLRQRLDQIAD
jgi:hypothetical protein